MYTPPVTPWEPTVPEVAGPTPQGEGGAEGMVGDWGEVVTRYPYRKVGMDYLLMEYHYSVNKRVILLIP